MPMTSSGFAVTRDAMTAVLVAHDGQTRNQSSFAQKHASSGDGSKAAQQRLIECAPARLLFTLVDGSFKPRVTAS